MKYICPFMLAALILSVPVLAAADASAAPAGILRTLQPVPESILPAAAPDGENPGTCPEGQDCMTLARAEQVFLEGTWWNGTMICGYAAAGNQSVPEYCCNGTWKQAAGTLVAPAVETLPADKRITQSGTPAVSLHTGSTIVASGSAPRRVPAIRKEEGLVDSFIVFFSGILTRPDCPPSLRACGKQCVDLQTDAAHCGLCGYTCPDGAVCTGGECRIYSST
ncbi:MULTISPECIES: hypothetical protein [unclassified Methanoregula]|uniref:hypothetical protein n=1 Tax=unclassified Methanoregula TaxID=2649730 RepID=UPI0009CC178F|nr:MULTISPECIES: hypothetical protein [unclassified Methanoregula]OPX62170.1 MAG: Stigma-specific protein, Stig1 [Methanoregula sp. PtaB.Bin085]OPY35621.1 MAG: Stigma-specific protein, Stig1 [Methanoregula sp. PtaU1.Bin006]